MKILVTDGHMKSALCAVRSLGRKGFEVHITENIAPVPLCSLSVFHRKVHFLPPYERPEEFDNSLLDLLRRERFDYLLPASDGAVARLSANREAILELTRVDLPPKESLELALSKTGLLRFAQEIGIPIPRTVFYCPQDRHMPQSLVDRVLGTLDFPVVAKTPRGETYQRVTYLNNAAQLKRYVFRYADETTHFQEYIEGVGHGYFALFEDGKPVLCQMHQRVWEYPATGGPSVLAKTIEDGELRELGGALLTRLNWNGLAMAEFKKSFQDNEYKLLEINPRLWGSLDLSVAAGADFPYLAVLRDRRTAANWRPAKDVYCLWPVPDGVLFLLARPLKFFQFIRALRSSQVHKNVWRNDLRPLLLQLREILYWMKKLLPHGKLRYPHGRPLLVNKISPRIAESPDPVKVVGDRS